MGKLPEPVAMRPECDRDQNTAALEAGIEFIDENGGGRSIGRSRQLFTGEHAAGQISANQRL